MTNNVLATDQSGSQAMSIWADSGWDEPGPADQTLTHNVMYMEGTDVAFYNLAAYESDRILESDHNLIFSDVGSYLVRNMPLEENVTVESSPDESGNSLRLVGADPTGRGATITRVFGAVDDTLSYQFRARAEQTTGGFLPRLTDATGAAATELGFSGAGTIRAWTSRNPNEYLDLGEYEPGRWYTFRVEVDIVDQTYDLYVDDILVLDEAAFLTPVSAPDRLVFQTQFGTGTYDVDDVDVTHGSATLVDDDFDDLPVGLAPTGWLSSLGVGDLDAWQALHDGKYDQNSVVADPMFVDAAADDYRLAAGSPAFDLGIEQVHPENAGPRSEPTGVTKR